MCPFAFRSLFHVSFQILMFHFCSVAVSIGIGIGIRVIGPSDSSAPTL
jgi:hypothetical protein